jgi:hypothetical protein
LIGFGTFAEGAQWPQSADRGHPQNCCPSRSQVYRRRRPEEGRQPRQISKVDQN